MELNHVATPEAISTYKASNNVFEGLIREIRALSKKKPDATMSNGKVKIVNRVLDDLKSILEGEPEGKYLDLLNDEELPQFSDAVLVMVQYETSLKSFYKRYRANVPIGLGDYSNGWVTQDVVNAHQKYLDRHHLYSEE